MKYIKKKYFFIIVAFIFFISGLSVAHYKIFPYYELRWIKNFTGEFFKKNEINFSQINEIGKYAFIDELIEKKYLINNSIKSLDELHYQVKDISFPMELVWEHKDKRKIFEVKMINKENIYHLEGEIDKNKINSYAYKLSNNKKEAVLVIPGSGKNQSYDIANNIRNYHGNLNFIKNEFDVFLYIKPNEGIRAIHNNKKKLRNGFLTGRMINQGNSYSSTYILETLFWVDYLKSKYESVIIMGLSQGGEASLINCLLTNPNKCVVASGYSVLNDKFSWLENGGIIIPNIQKKFNVETIKENIYLSSTRYIFTWGKKEYGVYKIESKNMNTCNEFVNLAIDCFIHSGGHEFPESQIIKLLRDKN